MDTKNTNLEKTIENLKANNFDTSLVKDKEAALEAVKSILVPGSSVACGGSVTLLECGVVDYMQSGIFEFLDRFKPGADANELADIAWKTKKCDYFLLSANAITENGEIFNVDATGNRISALIHGPKNVVIVAGTNKIVSDLAAARDRVRKTAGPSNAKRLKLSTPCVEDGVCHDCDSDKRICCFYLTSDFQRNKDRKKVILVEEALGY